METRKQMMVGEGMDQRPKQDVCERTLQEMQRLQLLSMNVGGLAHDFNNMLTSVLGSLALARQLPATDERAGKALADAELACLRARDLAMQLLECTKPGAEEWQSLNVVELLCESARLVLAGSTCELQLVGAGKSILVSGNRVQLMQVWQNILLNALQAMPDGGRVEIKMAKVTVCGAVEDSAALRAGCYARISITDSGHGIGAEILPHVFTPYFTTRKEGSGLGMTMVRNIVEGHVGRVEIESTPGQGTCLTVWLPVSTAFGAVEESTAAEPQVELVPYSGQGRILVVDDDAMVLEIAAGMLCHLGYTVRTVKNGQAAEIAYRHASCSKQPFAAVILDLTIPGDGNGALDVLARIKAIDPLAKVIVSSGYVSDRLLVEPEKYGFSAALSKPYTMQELGRLLCDVVIGSESSKKTVKSDK